MRIRHLATGAVVALILGNGAAFASAPRPTQTPAAPPTVTATPGGAQATFSFTQIPLSDAMVQNFIKTYPAVKAKTDAVAAKYKVKITKGGLDGGFSAFATSTAAAAEMNAAVTAYGYKDIFDWVDTTMSVMFATEWATLGAKQMDAMIAQMQQAAANAPAYLAQAQKLNPGLNLGNTAAYAQAAQGASVFASMRPTDANIAVVTPYVKQLQPLLKP